MKRYLAILICLTAFSNSQAAEFTGRFAFLGGIAHTNAEQSATAQEQTSNANQQGLRLMLDDSAANDQWSIHLRGVRQYLDHYTLAKYHYTDLFRARPLAEEWVDPKNGNPQTKIGYELDRAVYKRKFSSSSITLGRQAIDWGSGRFWQPLNVFGSFTPTDLDTDFKPGIDAVTFEAYPTDFSSLAATYVFSSESQTLSKNQNNVALYYRSQLGQNSEAALLASQVLGNTIIGGSLETSWQGMGLRLEASQTHEKTSHQSYLFWVAGMDYQFDNGTLVMAELYNNQRGANSTADLNAQLSNPLVIYGLQTQLSQHLLGIGIQKDVSPLWRMQYQLITSQLKNSQSSTQENQYSWLHQLNATYSMSNESTLLFSVLFSQGKGLDAQQHLASEFGQIPLSFTAKYVLYF